MARAQGRDLEEDRRPRSRSWPRASEDGRGRQEPVPRHPRALAGQRAAGARRSASSSSASQKQKRYFFNVSMAKKFMQTFLVSEACKELIDAGKTTSIRDLYYVTKHTIGDTKQNTFEEQDESDPSSRTSRYGRRAARGAAPLRRAQGLDGRPDHDHGHRRHHRPPADGLGRLGGALDRRGERHRVPQARGEVRPADREGRGLDALQRGQVLEAQQLHHRPGRRPAAARRAAARPAPAPAS